VRAGPTIGPGWLLGPSPSRIDPELVLLVLAARSRAAELTPVKLLSEDCLVKFPIHSVAYGVGQLEPSCRSSAAPEGGKRIFFSFVLSSGSESP